MAILFLNITSVRRSDGRTATAAAAYRAGERLRDERTGEVFNYSRRTDVLHKEIMLPSPLASESLAWARDRASLWNHAELAEGRPDSRVAREFLVTIPHELSSPQRIALARTLARDVTDRYGVAVDMALHAPRTSGDARNFHLHLLATTRQAMASGLGAKAGLDSREFSRSPEGIARSGEEFRALRERSAGLINEALREANLAVRVDHRTLAAQGLEREPQARLPWGAYRAEQRGQYSEIAERVRASYRARVLARDGPRPMERMEDIRRQAREEWSAWRKAHGAGERTESAKVLGLGLEHEPDLGL